MNLPLLAFIAASCNFGTVLCIKWCISADANGRSALPCYFGIIVTILATQFLLLDAERKGLNLGLVIAIVIVSVMIPAALIRVDRVSGAWTFVKPWELPALQISGYGLAVIGVVLVGVAQFRTAKEKEEKAPRELTSSQQ